MSENKRSMILRFLGSAIPILLVVYVLSDGPAAAFICHSDGTAKYPEYIDLHESFYGPLRFVVNGNSWFELLHKEYVTFWFTNF